MNSFSLANRPITPIPGYNVDALNISAGMTMLDNLGYTDTETRMVIEYALQRHTRGEEEQAQRSAIDTTFHGIPLTQWYMVLSAAMAGA